MAFGQQHPRLAPTEAIAAERGLLDLAQRLQRRSQDGRSPEWRALALHLSRLQPPAPLPHHRIVARALLEDAAQRHGGQVFGLRRGDIVLLCPAAGLLLPPPRFAAPSQDLTLAETLARLLSVDAPDPAAVLSVWTLPEQAPLLLSYAADRLAETAAAPAETEADTDIGAVEAYAARVEVSRITDLVHRQTGVILAQPQDGGGMRPIFRELRFAMGGVADPFLFRHLAGRFDRRMLDALRQERGRGSPLDPAPLDLAMTPMLHVNLTLAGILSDDFAALAREMAGLPLGVEVALLEAGADPRGFARAGRILAASGMTLVLDAVSHLALLLTCPATLRADLVKLDWSPLLPGLAAADRALIEAAVARFGADSIVLQRAETEAALLWGLAQGIRRFQGRHVDAMLAASRVSQCPAAEALGCTLRQCSEREAATGPAGRRPCGNTALLDAAVRGTREMAVPGTRDMAAPAGRDMAGP
jgi:hypothetical protein